MRRLPETLRLEPEEVPMTPVLQRIAAVAAAVVLTGCCLKFNDLAPGTQVPVGAVFTTDRKTVRVEPFQWSNGTWTNNGYARVDGSQLAGGTAPELRTNNANLNFQLNYPLQRLSFKFADFGGNENLKINNDFRNVANFLGLHNTTVGGVLVQVTAVQDVSSIRGEMVLQGPIQGFSVGGQEFWIDDVCPDR